MEEKSTVHNAKTELTCDWWETLFQPRFGILDWTLATQQSNKTEDEDETDTSNDPNIYRRVWRRDKKGKINFYRDLEKNGKEKQMPEVEHTLHTRAVETQTAQCIWNAKELEMMRNYVREVKTENVKLRALVMEQTPRLQEIEQKCRAQSKLLTKKQIALEEAVKANDRFHILTQALSEHTERGGALCNHLEVQLGQNKEETGFLRRDLGESEQQRVRLEQENTKLRDRLSQAANHYKEEQALVIEQTQLKQADLIKRLQKSNERLEVELRREKDKHAGTRRGFDQLMRHYSTQNPTKAAQQEDLLIAKMQLF